MKIRNSLALITGASGGIGAATARELAAAGAKVVLLARTQSKLDAVADDIRTAGGVAHVYPCDLGDAEAVNATAERIKAEVGVPDILINNAGAGRWLAVEETDPAEAVSMMSTPYFAAFFTTRAFVQDMIRRGSGRIANVNSPMAYLVIPGATGYAACRCALRGLNDSLRAELRGTGVGVTHLVFGEVTSDYFDNNPGAHERIPSISKMIPVLSPETTARYIVRAIQADKDEIVRPLTMKMIVLFTRFMPKTSAWINAKTGWQRPPQLP
ncbi:MAG: SDR family NAD(P)-dependent oxidoreductase [Deltaproteobacteria bacterium]|nr:SDR family NAD(P)-dependent oxidoreductase [Deltaproteobacteria bacterium]MBW2162054.1 SDR family NAD(P)-dependent oxidoreductase [Deltaproteobacteria bacterium]MBW2688031.1 SDR family NAD(P)-dependent oxidoreductase [Deltaproteobacteria bacterium]